MSCEPRGLNHNGRGRLLPAARLTNFMPLLIRTADDEQLRDQGCETLA